MSENLSQELIRITEIINSIYVRGKSHQLKFNKTNLSSVETIFAVTILERFLGNLNATRTLLEDLQSNPNLEHGIGLILRNNLSLCKTVFGHRVVTDQGSETTEFFRAVFGENLQRTIKLLLRRHQKDELLPLYASIKSEFAFILNELNINLEEIEHQKFIAPKELPKEFENLENLYVAYSKYEHFGLNTLMLQVYTEDKDILNRIKIATHYSLQGILYCLLMLEINDFELLNINRQLAGKRNHA